MARSVTVKSVNPRLTRGVTTPGAAASLPPREPVFERRESASSQAQVHLVAVAFGVAPTLLNARAHDAERQGALQERASRRIEAYL